jgi:two-component system, NtrC family, nitrogen regulation response regulator NtrX
MQTELNQEQVSTATRILVMSGDAQLGTVLNVLLQDRGFLTAATFTAQSGFDQLEAEKFDIAILDESLPGSLGTEVLQQVMIEHSEVPVIFLTNDPLSNTSVEAILLGAYGVIAKPIQINQLAMVLVGAKARKHSQRPAAISDLCCEPCAR